MTTLAQAPPAPPGTGTGKPLAWLTPKWLVTILITLILVVGQVSFQILESLWVLPVAIGTAVGVEMGLSRLVRGRVGSIQSAYISGTSMTVLTQTQQGLLWPFALGAALSITSKYALTYRGKHLWNPTNLGISLLVLLAPGSVSVLSEQWGNAMGPVLVVWTVGLLVASRAKILHVTATYALAYVAFAGLRSGITGSAFVNELAPITGPMYQLFLFFMITDPATTVRSRKARMVVAVLIAAVECAIRLAGELDTGGLAASVLLPLQQAPPIFALALVGPLAKLWDLNRTSFRNTNPNSGT